MLFKTLNVEKHLSIIQTFSTQAHTNATQAAKDGYYFDKDDQFRVEQARLGNIPIITMTKDPPFWQPFKVSKEKVFTV